MRKIFTLLAAVLVSMGMFVHAATPIADLNFEIKTGDTSVPGNYVYSSTNTPSIKIQNSVTCVIISDGGGSTAPTFNGSDAPSGGKRWMAFCPDTDCSATISVMSNKKEFFIQNKDGKFFTYTNTANAVEEVLVANLKANQWYAMCGGSSQVYVSKIVFSVSCTAPATALTLQASKTADVLVGDVITFSTQGGNGAAVKYFDGENEIASPWTATSGSHSITAVQAENDGICGGTTAALELNVISHDSVATAEVSGANECYVGKSVTLTCTAANATTYQWYNTDGAIDGATAKTYVFTPAAEGSYGFYCMASNQYNNAPVRSNSFVVTATVKPAAVSCANIIPASSGTAPTEVGTEIDLDAASEGGKIFVAGMKTPGESIVYNALGLGLMKGGADSIRVEFNNLIAEGSVIKLVMAAGGTSERGLNLQTPAKSSVFAAKWTPAEAGEVKEFEYTVPAGSKLIGDYRILLQRNNSVYLQSVSMADCGAARVIPVDTVPALKASPDSINLAITAAQAADSAVVTFSGKNLTPGNYALTVPDLAGLTITPTSVTVGANGKLSAAVMVKYATDATVDAASTSFSLTIGELIQTVKIGYSAVHAKQYMSSVNIEQLVLDNGKSYNIGAALAAAHIDYAHIDALDSLNDEKTARNEPYLGLKLKTSGAYVAGWLHANDTITVKFGAVGGDIKVRVNGQAQTFSKDSMANATLGRRAAAEEYVELLTTSSSTVVLKQIMINEAIQPVILPAQTGFTVTCASAENGTVKVGGKTSATYEAGDTVVVTVTPAEGYHVVSVTAGNAVLEPVEGVYSFVMPAQDVTVSATFAETIIIVPTLAVDPAAVNLKATAAEPADTAKVTFSGRYLTPGTYNLTIPNLAGLTVAPQSVTVAADSTLNAEVTIVYTSAVNVAAAATEITLAIDTLAAKVTVNYGALTNLCGELIKAVHTGSKTADVTGIVGGSVDKNIASDGKFGGAGKFWGLTLADGVTFAEGDILNVHVSTAASQGTIAIYADKNGENMLYNTQTVGEVGDNLIELPAALDGRATFYICRTSDNNWNGYVDTISVTRDCSTEPRLAVSPEFVRLKATLTEPSVSETVTFTGKNLTPGTYNLVLTNVAGLSVNPTSVTVPEGGKLSAEVTLTYTSAEDVMADDAELSLTIGELSAAVAIEYAAKVSKQYATSLNFEQLVLDYGKSTSAEMALETANIDYNNIDQLDSLNGSKDYNNYPFLGLKLKKEDASLSFWLRQGSKVNLKFGNIGASFNVYFGDGVMPVTADMANMLVSDSNVVSCDPVAADTYVSIVCGSTKTIVIKQIMIDEDIQPVNVDPGEDPTKDGDATIKSLSINGVAITREGTTYAYEVPADVNLAEVEVVYELNSAKATGNPASGFKVAVPAAGAAANEQTLTVTAESGAQVEYTIFVTRAESQGLFDLDATAPATKLIRNGQLLIIKNNRTYTVLGQEL